MKNIRAWGNLGQAIMSAGFGFEHFGGAFKQIGILKKILAVFIFASSVIGIALVSIAIINLVKEDSEIHPILKFVWDRQNYIVLLIIGLAYIICSCFGYLGIWESRDRLTKVFMMMSVTFGFGLLQVFLIWVVVTDILMPGSLLMKATNSTRSVDVKSQQYYMYMLFASSFIQIMCGFFAYLICTNCVYSRGYYTVTQQEAEVLDFFEEWEEVTRRTYSELIR